MGPNVMVGGRDESSWSLTKVTGKGVRVTIRGLTESDRILWEKVAKDNALIHLCPCDRAELRLEIPSQGMFHVLSTFIRRD